MTISPVPILWPFVYIFLPGNRAFLKPGKVAYVFIRVPFAYLLPSPWLIASVSRHICVVEMQVVI